MQQKLSHLCALCAVLLVFCLTLGSARCIQPPVDQKNQTPEAPEDMVMFLDRYADVVTAGFTKIDADFHELADDVGRVFGNSSEVTDAFLGIMQIIPGRLSWNSIRRMVLR